MSRAACYQHSEARDCEKDSPVSGPTHESCIRYNRGWDSEITDITSSDGHRHEHRWWKWELPVIPVMCDMTCDMLYEMKSQVTETNTTQVLKRCIHLFIAVAAICRSSKLSGSPSLGDGTQTAELSPLISGCLPPLSSPLLLRAGAVFVIASSQPPGSVVVFSKMRSLTTV